MAIDTGCSSTIIALESAFQAIESGVCDAAIVGGTNVQISPYTGMEFWTNQMLSRDGKCKTFDESGIR